MSGAAAAQRARKSSKAKKAPERKARGVVAQPTSDIEVDGDEGDYRILLPWSGEKPEQHISGYDAFFKMFLRNWAVSACVQKIATGMMTGGWELVAAKDVDNPSEANRVMVEEFIGDCHPDRTFEEILTSVCYDLALAWKAYVEVLPCALNEGKQPAGLRTLPQGTIRPIVNASGEMSDERAFVQRIRAALSSKTAEEIYLPRHRVLWLRLPGPSQNGVNPVSPIERLEIPLKSGLSAETYIHSFFESGGKMGLVLENGAWGQEQAEEAFRYYQRRYGNTKKGFQFVILYDGTTIKEPPKAHGQWGEFIDVQQFDGRKVCAVYDVDPRIIGYPGEGNLGGKGEREQLYNEFYLNNVNPKKDLLSKLFTKQILQQGFGIYDWVWQLKPYRTDADETARSTLAGTFKSMKETGLFFPSRIQDVNHARLQIAPDLEEIPEQEFAELSKAPEATVAPAVEEDPDDLRYNPDQPRDADGKFGSGGGSGSFRDLAGKTREDVDRDSAELDAKTRSHWDSLTEKERTIIGAYTRGKSASLNRDPGKLERGEFKKGSFDEFRAGMDVDQMTAALNKGAMPEDRIVYSGLDLRVLGAGLDLGHDSSDEDFAKAVGRSFRHPGFVSTTTDFEVGEKFMRRHKDRVLLEIDMPKGTKGMWVGDQRTANMGITDNKVSKDGEREFILQRAAEFKITGVGKKNGVRTLKVSVSAKRKLPMFNVPRPRDDDDDPPVQVDDAALLDLFTSDERAAYSERFFILYHAPGATRYEPDQPRAGDGKWTNGGGGGSSDGAAGSSGSDSDSDDDAESPKARVARLERVIASKERKTEKAKAAIKDIEAAIDAASTDARIQSIEKAAKERNKYAEKADMARVLGKTDDAAERDYETAAATYRHEIDGLKSDLAPAFSTEKGMPYADVAFGGYSLAQHLDAELDGDGSAKSAVKRLKRTVSKAPAILDKALDKTRKKLERARQAVRALPTAVRRKPQSVAEKRTPWSDIETRMASWGDSTESAIVAPLREIISATSGRMGDWYAKPSAGIAEVLKANLLPGAGKLQDDFRARLKDYVAGSRAQAAEELARLLKDAGVEVRAKRVGDSIAESDKGSVLDFIKLSANTAFDALFGRITSTLKSTFLAALRGGWTRKELVDKLAAKATDVAEADLSTIVRTHATDFFNLARQKAAEESEAVAGYEYSAILDDRTTEVCKVLDGLQIKASDPDVDRIRPPNHHNCRSLLTFVLHGEAIKTDRRKLDRGLKLIQAQFGGKRNAEVADADAA